MKNLRNSTHPNIACNTCKFYRLDKGNLRPFCTQVPYAFEPYPYEVCDLHQPKELL